MRDLTGQKFNMLTALKHVKAIPRGPHVWLFQCDCGNTKEMRGNQVVSGIVLSCGCKRKMNLKGVVSGFLTYVGEVEGPGKRMIRCDCVCGTKDYKTQARNFIYGAVKSCGCMQRVVKWYDLNGQKFGKLTVIEPDNTYKASGGIGWICHCDCGGKKTVSSYNLRRKNQPTRSCGCLHAEASALKLYNYNVNKHKK